MRNKGLHELRTSGYVFHRIFLGIEFVKMQFFTVVEPRRSSLQRAEDRLCSRWLRKVATCGLKPPSNAGLVIVARDTFWTVVLWESV